MSKVRIVPLKKPTYPRPEVVMTWDAYVKMASGSNTGEGVTWKAVLV